MGWTNDRPKESQSPWVITWMLEPTNEGALIAPWRPLRATSVLVDAAEMLDTRVENSTMGWCCNQFSLKDNGNVSTYMQSHAWAGNEPTNRGRHSFLRPMKTLTFICTTLIPRFAADTLRQLPFQTVYRLY